MKKTPEGYVRRGTNVCPIALTLPGEVWVPARFGPRLTCALIPHDVSNYGRLRRSADGSLVPQFFKRSGTLGTTKYWHANFTLSPEARSDLGIRRTSSVLVVSAVVCRSFHGDPPHESMQAGHVDENSADDRAENLRWMTAVENCNMPLHRRRKSEGVRRHHERKKNRPAQGRAA